eukprot:5615531-Amphidinium_carterae.1
MFVSIFKDKKTDKENDLRMAPEEAPPLTGATPPRLSPRCNAARQSEQTLRPPHPFQTLHFRPPRAGAKNSNAKQI